MTIKIHICSKYNKQSTWKQMWSNALNLLAQTFIATTLQTAHKNCVPGSKCGEQNKKIYTQYPAFFPLLHQLCVSWAWIKWPNGMQDLFDAALALLKSTL